MFLAHEPGFGDVCAASQQWSMQNQSVMDEQKWPEPLNVCV